MKKRKVKWTVVVPEEPDKSSLEDQISSTKGTKGK